MRIEFSGVIPVLVKVAARIALQGFTHRPIREFSAFLDQSRADTGTFRAPDQSRADTGTFRAGISSSPPVGISYPPEIARSTPVQPSIEHIEPSEAFIEVKKAPEAGPRLQDSIEPIEVKIVQAPEESKAKSIASGCIPCSLGHFGTCSGLLNEAVRFAGNGLGDDEVIMRVNMCLDELNAMERVDMRPEMVTQLIGWERELAEQTLVTSRAVRHDLEALANGGDKADLEAVASKVQTNRNQIGKTWFKQRLASLTPEEKAEMQRRVLEKLTEAENG